MPRCLASSHRAHLRAAWLLLPIALGSSLAPSAHAAKPTAAGSKGAQTVATDPENKRGISPFWQQVVLGDGAAIAHDFSTARSYYQAALTADPKNPVGHLRLAEVSLKENQLDHVAEYIAAALRFSVGNDRLTLQSLFFAAVYHEKKGALPDAIIAWTKYRASALTAETAAKKAPAGPIPPPARGYAATADARIAFLKKELESASAYEAVRARIQASVSAADQVTGAAASDTTPRP